MEKIKWVRYLVIANPLSVAVHACFRARNWRPFPTSVFTGTFCSQSGQVASSHASSFTFTSDVSFGTSATSCGVIPPRLQRTPRPMTLPPIARVASITFLAEPPVVRTSSTTKTFFPAMSLS